MTTIRDSQEALKQLRTVLDALEELEALYVDAETPQDEEADRESDQEVLDRIVEEATERGMDEEGIERAFRALLAYAKKSAE